jgi:Undecaprenyl-phosphate glucose phosphotransferase
MADAWARLHAKLAPTVAGDGRRFSPSILIGLVAAGDLLAMWFSGAAIYLSYLDARVHPLSFYLVAMFLGSCGMLAGFSTAGVYANVVNETPGHQVRRLLPVMLIVFAGLATIAFALKISEEYSRVWGFSWFLASAALVCTLRYGTHGLVHRLARRGYLTRMAVIVGAGKQGERLARTLKQTAGPWLRVVGFFDDRAGRVAGSVEGYPMLGGLDDLIALGRRRRFDDILVSLPWSAEERIHDVVQRLKVLPASVRLAPDLAGFGYAHAQHADYGGLDVLTMIHNPLGGRRHLLKVTEDRVLSGLLLVALLPVLLAIAVCIKLDSPGPVFFRQRRYGFNNRVIKVFKFRTMYVDQQDANAERLTSRGDPRVTRVGAVLRRRSLDELPQLINVLRGEMSLVGPRPHALKASVSGELYDRIVADYAERHKMKPGLTGWAQVNGWRGDTDTREKLEKRVEHDLHYIQHWSLWLDLWILLRTLRVLVRDENAY